MARSRAKEKEPSELQETLDAARKKYGSTSVRTAAEVNQPLRIPTNVFMLDFALCGGIPFNRASMFAGRKHAGKSMLGSLIMRGCQDILPDQESAVIDVEGTFEATWARKLGVDLDRVHIFEADTGEMAIDMAEAVLSSKEIGLVVIDSLAAMAPTAEIEGAAEDQFYALQSRLIAKLIRKTTHILVSERKRNHFVTLLYVNQLRARIGGPPKASPFIIPGGHALEHTTSVQGIIKNREMKGTRNGIETVLENQHSFTLEKNKLCNGPRSGEFIVARVDTPDRHVSEGMVDDAHTLITYSKKMGYYRGGGKKWTLTVDDKDYTFPNADAAIGTVTEDRDMYAALRKQLIQRQATDLGLPDKFVRTIV
jgi:recombination protein RecA